MDVIPNKAVKMKVLVTGVSGCVGRPIRESFEKAGWTVAGCVRSRKRDDKDYCVDLSSPDAVKCLPAEPYDVVINASGIVSTDATAKQHFAVNAYGTKHLLDWAKQNGCKHFVQISSVSALGFRLVGKCGDETAVKRYDGPFAVAYMRSKAMAERFVESGGIPYTILRLPPILGRNDTFLSPKIIRSLQDKTIFLRRGVESLTTMLCVDDIAPIVQRVVERGAENEIYHCGDYHLCWEELIAEYAKAIGVDMPSKRYSVAGVVWKTLLHLYTYPLAPYSLFGSYFPNGKMLRNFGEFRFTDWRQAIADYCEDWKRAHSLNS